jgi:outer membrane protein OmpA-like peptidoglycan-associated protein
MRKFRLLALVFGLMLSVSGYSQTSILEHLLFQGTFYKNFFPNSNLAFSSYTSTDYLNIVALGAAWEQPIWKGLGFLGIEAGYSSGSRFGGKSSMDFIPVMLNAGYDFLLGDFFSVGPNLKLGGFGLFTPIGNKFVPLIAGHLEGEFRYKPFPLSLYAAGGVDFFPTVSGVLPALEVGMRFRPYALFNRSNANEKSEAVASSQAAPVASAQGTAAPAAASETSAQAPVASAQGTAAPAPAAAATATPAAPAPVASTQGTAAPAPAAAAAATPAAPAPVVSAQGTAAPAPAAAAAAPAAPAPVASAQGASTPAAPLQPNRGSQAQAAGISLGGTPVVFEGRQGHLRSVYFEPDTDVLLETSRASLDAVGREMSADSSLRLILRAYTTSAKTPEGRLMVSRERAEFCQDYITRRYGIASNRITSYHYGSDRTPVMATDDMESQRCVELIILE